MWKAAILTTKLRAPYKAAQVGEAPSKTSARVKSEENQKQRNSPPAVQNDTTLRRKTSLTVEP